VASPTGASAVFTKVLSKGMTMFILGDSILNLHLGERRVVAVMRLILEQRTPWAQWMVCNEVHGGQYIGQTIGTPFGTRPLMNPKLTLRLKEETLKAGIQLGK
jgi:hypothetical protein